MKPLQPGQIETIRTGPTPSMVPLSPPNGWVIVAHWPWPALIVGMIVLHAERDLAGTMIAHQIVNIDKGSICNRDIKRDPSKWSLWLKGINNPQMDPFVCSYDEYIGLVIGNAAEGYYPYAQTAMTYNGEYVQEITEWNCHNKKYFPKKILKTFNHA